MSEGAVGAANHSQFTGIYRHHPIKNTGSTCWRALGGSINANLVSWQGLVDTKINLLSYLNQLISLNANIANYDDLLKTDLHATQLLDAAINVLKKRVYC